MRSGNAMFGVHMARKQILTLAYSVVRQRSSDARATTIAQVWQSGELSPSTPGVNACSICRQMLQPSDKKGFRLWGCRAGQWMTMIQTMPHLAEAFRI